MHLVRTAVLALAVAVPLAAASPAHAGCTEDYLDASLPGPYQFQIDPDQTIARYVTVSGLNVTVNGGVLVADAVALAGFGAGEAREVVDAQPGATVTYANCVV